MELEGKGVGEVNEGKEMGTYLSDQCKTASYAHCKITLQLGLALRGSGFL